MAYPKEGAFILPTRRRLVLFTLGKAGICSPTTVKGLKKPPALMREIELGAPPKVKSSARRIREPAMPAQRRAEAKGGQPARNIRPRVRCPAEKFASTANVPRTGFKRSQGASDT